MKFVYSDKNINHKHNEDKNAKRMYVNFPKKLKSTFLEKLKKYIEFKWGMKMSGKIMYFQRENLF